MKLSERVIEGRLKKDTSISKNQFSFMPGRSIIDVIHFIRRLSELYRNRKRDLHMVFINLQKAYDRVSCEVLWDYLEKKEGLMVYI